MDTLNQIGKNISVRAQIQQQEIEKLTQVLQQSNSNISEATRLLGIPRSTLFHRLKKYGLI